VYVNEKAQGTFQELDAPLQETLGIAADEILGGPLQRFHKDARRLEKSLRNPASLPYRFELTLGDTTLRASINGVFGGSNAVHGYVVTFEDDSGTARAAKRVAEVEYEAARAQGMVDSAAVSMWFVDKDLIIRHLNTAALKMMRDMEK